MRCTKRLPLILSVLALPLIFSVAANAKKNVQDVEATAGNSAFEPELWQLHAHGHNHLNNNVHKKMSKSHSKKHHHHKASSSKKKAAVAKRAVAADNIDDIAAFEPELWQLRAHGHHHQLQKDHHKKQQKHKKKVLAAVKKIADKKKKAAILSKRIVKDGPEGQRVLAAVDDDEGNDDQENDDEAVGVALEKGKKGGKKEKKQGHNQEDEEHDKYDVDPADELADEYKKEHDGKDAEEVEREKEGDKEEPKDGKKDPQDGKEPKEPKDGKEPKEPKDGKEPRDPKDGKEPKEPKDGKEPKEPKDGKEPKEPKDGKEPKEPKDGKEPKEPKDGKEPKEPKDGKEPKEPKDRKEPKEPKDRKEPKDPKDGKEPKDPKDGKEPKEPKDGKEPKNPKDGKEPKEPKDGKAPADTKEPKEPKDGKNPKDGKAPVDAKTPKDGKAAVPPAAIKPAPIVPVQHMGEFLTKCNTPGQVALTFSEGPSEATTQMLEILKEGKARVTFFANATWLEYMQYAGVTRRAYTDGHLIGMTYRLPNDSSKGMTDVELKADIAKQATKIFNLIGKYPKYVRLHDAGLKDPKLEPTIREMGYTLVGFNLDEADYKYNTREQAPQIAGIYESTFTKQADAFGRKGSYVVVGYDIPASGAAAALPDIITTIIRNEYDMVRLDGCNNDSSPYKKSALLNDGFVGDDFSFGAAKYVHGQSPVSVQNGKAVAGNFPAKVGDNPKTGAASSLVSSIVPGAVGLVVSFLFQWLNRH